jgi:hypothetical protein
VYAELTAWGKTDMFVTSGTTGFKSESKGMIAKVYVNLLEGKLIPACRQWVECRPMNGANQPWVFQHDNAPAHTAKTTASVAAWPIRFQSDELAADKPISVADRKH